MSRPGIKNPKSPIATKRGLVTRPVKKIRYAKEAGTTRRLIQLAATPGSKRGLKKMRARTSRDLHKALYNNLKNSMDSKTFGLLERLARRQVRARLGRTPDFDEVAHEMQRALWKLSLLAKARHRPGEGSN